MKILINGPKFYNYNTEIMKGFKSLGNEIFISNWPDLFSDFSYNLKFFMYSKINGLLDGSNAVYEFEKDRIYKYNRSLVDQIKMFNPDLIFTIKGDILFPETIKYIKEKTNGLHVIWGYDSALRYPNVLNSAKYYDLFYTSEPSDIPELRSYVSDPKVLPLAYDPDTYFNIEDQEKTIDICFIGDLNSHLIRKNILEELILRYADLNIQIWGKSWTWYNPFLNYEYKVKRKKLGKCVNNYYVRSNISNEIYNKSKICLNIHHTQSVDGLNARTFEILGSGGFELVDYKSSLNELFEVGNNIESYKDKSELFEKIDYYIDHDEELRKIAKRGYDEAIKHHTYQNRAKVIIKDVESLM